MSALHTPRRAGPVLLALLVALTASACGQGGGGGGEPSAAEEEKAVETATVAYIEETTKGQSDAEKASSLKVGSVKLDGDSAEAKATSSETKNKYDVTLARAEGSWEGKSVLTDRPEKKPKRFGSRNPAKGPGQVVPTDTVEQQIQSKLLKPLKLKGRASCPPKVAIRKGNNFECKLVGSSLKGTVRVTQKDGQGNLRYKLNVTG